MLRTTRFSFIVLITAIHNHELLPLFPIVFSLFRDRPIIRSLDFLTFLAFTLRPFLCIFSSVHDFFSRQIELQYKYIPLFSLIAIIIVIVALCEKIMHTYVQRRHDT